MGIKYMTMGIKYMTIKNDLKNWFHKIIPRYC